MTPPPGRVRHPRRRTRAFRSALADERGIALVLTLLVVALLSAMIIEFDYRTRLDVRAASNFRDATRAQLLAESGVEVVKGVLEWDVQHSPAYDSEDEMWAQFNNQSIPVPSVPDAVVTFVVSDEGGKLDLNQLYKSGTAEPPEPHIADLRDTYRRLLEQVLGAEDFEGSDKYDVNELVDALLDWLDEDDQTRPLGAEEPDYRRLDPPYGCANGPLRTIDELRLVKGYTPELVERLRPHVTAIFSGGKNTHSFQAGAQPDKININTASRDLLASLHEELGPAEADTMWAYIHPPEPHPVEDVSWQGLLSTFPGLGVEQTAQKLATMVQARSDLFSAHVTVEIMGDTNQGTPEVRTRRSVDALLQRKSAGGGKGIQVLAWRSE